MWTFVYKVLSSHANVTEEYRVTVSNHDYLGAGAIALELTDTRFPGMIVELVNIITN